MTLILDQPRVAILLESTPDTIYLWENNKVRPTFPFMPRIIEFLGFCPIDPDDSPGRRLAWARICNGLSQERMAKSTGMDPSTLSELERGWWLKRERFLERALAFLANTAYRKNRVIG